MNIPKPFPDEHVLGWRGRIKFFNHHPTVKHTIQELRLWCDSHHPNCGFVTKGTSQLFVLSKASMLTVTEFAQHHTLIPFTRIFSPPLEEAPSKELHNILMTHGLRAGKRGAWYCTSCIKQDLKEYGSSYWRRSHQLLGIDWCHIHGHQLEGANNAAAFDQDPIFAKEKYEPLVPPGPKFLDKAELTIQRYAAISIALLNGRKRFDRFKVSAMIALQFSARQHIEWSETGREFSSVLETLAPAYWISRFIELRTKSYDSNVLDFKRLFAQNVATQDTERYVVALAMLFNSADTAVRQLEQSHEIKISFPIQPFHVSQNPWLGEQVLNEYVRHECSHRSFSEAIGINFRAVSNALTVSGLPDFNCGYDAKRNALNDFFNGTSLREASDMHNIDVQELEHMLRVAGSRLHRALTQLAVNQDSMNKFDSKLSLPELLLEKD